MSVYARISGRKRSCLLQRKDICVRVCMFCILDKKMCKWKEKVAALGRDTCRFLPRIARKVTLPITHPEEILAVIPNEEEIHCHHLGKYVTLPPSPSARINDTCATHNQPPSP